MRFVYMYPNFGEITQFLNISREASVVVQKSTKECVTTYLSNFTALAIDGTIRN